MSFLEKLVGAIHKLRESEELLGKKQGFLEKKIDVEIQTARKHGTKNKCAAIAALKRKKLYKKQIIQIDCTLIQIEMQREVLEGAYTKAQVLNTMSEAAYAMELARKDIDVDKVYAIMDEIAAEHIDNNIAFHDDIDEEELEKELEELEREDLDKEMGISVPTDNLPEVPNAGLVKDKPKPRSKQTEDDEEFTRLQSWVP